MLVEKTIGNLKDYPVNERKIDYFPVEWYELDKKLLRGQTIGGEEVGIRLDAQHLHENDVLLADKEHIVAVQVKPCELTRVQVSTMSKMGHLCFELGNRHLSLAIEEDSVCVPYDEPTYLYLQKLGFEPEKVTEKFTHFTVCHAHAHTGGHTHKNIDTDIHTDIHTHGDHHHDQ